MVVYKAKKSPRTGSQFYQSEGNKRAVLDADGKETKAEKAIRRAFKEKYKSGDISREEYINSGATEARIFSDSIYDAINNPPKSNGTGKAVMKGRGGKFKGRN